MSEMEKMTFDGEIYSEIIEIEGKKYEHIGFKDYQNQFGKFMEQSVGKKVRITVEILEDIDKKE